MRFLFDSEMKLVTSRLLMMFLGAMLAGGSLALQAVYAQGTRTMQERVLASELLQGEQGRVIARLVADLDAAELRIRDLENQTSTLRGLGAAFGALVFLVQGVQVIWGRRKQP